jgi:PAS domain S-box-containing protein
MGGTIRVLHVDDEPDFAEVTATYLEREGDGLAVETATRAEEALDKLRPGIDCVVSDYEMPGMNGLEFLEAVRDEYEKVPFILYTGRGSEAVASDAIAAGVTDYLQKGSGTEQYELLANRIQNAVRARREVQRADRQEELMRLTEVAGGTGGFEVDLETEEILLTEGARRLMPAPVDTDLSLDDAIHLCHPEDRADIRRTLRQVAEGGEEAAGTWHLQEPDGDERVIDVSFTPAETTGSTTIVRGAVHDITEQRERQQELRSERRFVKQALDALDDLFYVFDTGGEIRRWNEQVPEVTGYAESDLVDMDALDFVPKDEREAIADAIDTCLSDGEVTVEADLLTADGERIPYEFTGGRLTDEDGNTTGLVGIGRDLTERRQRERRFRALVEESSDIISVVDSDGQFEYQSPSLKRILGYEPEETVGDKAWEYIHPADREPVKETFESWLSTPDTPEPTEYRARDTDGSWHWMEARGNNQLENPAVEGYVVNSRDITDRKARERELEEVTRQYQTLAESFPDGAVYLVDSDRTFIRARGEELEAVGLSADEVEGATPHDLFPADIADRLCHYLEEAMAGSANTFEQEYMGQRYRVQIVPVQPESERTTQVMAVAQNITDYADDKKLEQRDHQLSRLHEATRELFGADSPEEVAKIASDAADDILDLPLNGVHFYDEHRDGLVPVAVSEASRELLGEPPVLDDGIAWEAFRSSEPQIYGDVRNADNVYNPETPIRSELHLPMGDHGVFICSSTEEGSFDDVDVELAQTLTANTKAALERIEQAQELQTREKALVHKNDRLEEFTSIVSHDLRNPLNVAEMSLEIAQEDCDSEHVDRAKNAIERGQTLINDLLTLARDGSEIADFEPVRLPAVAQRSWETVETGGATFESDTTQRIEADRSRLQQLFENFFRNAIEHGSTSPASQNAVERGATNNQMQSDEAVEPAGGKLTVRVGDVENGFYVADTGTGIADEHKDTIFERGYSTDEDGTGFGLRIVEQIVSAHGWEIAVTDSEQGGARFEITGVKRVE